MKKNIKSKTVTSDNGTGLLNGSFNTKKTIDFDDIKNECIFLKKQNEQLKNCIILLQKDWDLLFSKYNMCIDIILSAQKDIIKDKSNCSKEEKETLKKIIRSIFKDREDS